MRCFDWRKNHVFINSVELTDYGSGDDVLKIRRRADIGTDEMGVDGKMHLSLSADKSGEIVVKLKSTSPSNSMLSKLAAGQDFIETFVPIVVSWHDSYRLDEAKSTVGYIKKHAEIDRGGKIVEQEWTIVVQDLYVLLGAPAFAGLPLQLAEAV